jgi:predicted nucleic acid-binding protein
LSVANLAILDTSVYIDNLRSGRFKREILDLKFVVRCSAVVLAELSRGARSPLMRRFVDGLAKSLQVIAPNEREWIESGRIVNRLGEAKGYDIQKTREIHFDVLGRKAASKRMIRTQPSFLVGILDRRSGVISHGSQQPRGSGSQPILPQPADISLLPQFYWPSRMARARFAAGRSQQRWSHA